MVSGSAAPPAPGGALPSIETTPQLDPNGTIALARLLLERETQSGWKEAHQAEVKTWQLRRGETPDGKFGRNSAYTMAQEVGVLPLIRYWPSSVPKAKALAEYREFLNNMANAIQQQRPEDQAHATALRLSALREDARSYGVANPKPESPQSVDQLVAQITKIALGGVS